MQINTRSDGAPRRPRGMRPISKKDASPEWKAWFKAENDIYEISKNAIEAYESLWYGAAAMRNRRARNRAHKVKMDSIYLKRGFADLQTKLNKNGNLSESGRDRYMRYQKELKSNG